MKPRCIIPWFQCAIINGVWALTVAGNIKAEYERTSPIHDFVYPHLKSMFLMVPNNTKCFLDQFVTDSILSLHIFVISEQLSCDKWSASFINKGGCINLVLPPFTSKPGMNMMFFFL